MLRFIFLIVPLFIVLCCLAEHSKSDNLSDDKSVFIKPERKAPLAKLEQNNKNTSNLWSHKIKASKHNRNGTKLKKAKRKRGSKIKKKNLRKSGSKLRNKRIHDGTNNNKLLSSANKRQKKKKKQRAKRNLAGRDFAEHELPILDESGQCYSYSGGNNLDCRTKAHFERKNQKCYFISNAEPSSSYETWPNYCNIGKDKAVYDRFDCTVQTWASQPPHDQRTAQKCKTILAQKAKSEKLFTVRSEENLPIKFKMCRIDVMKARPDDRRYFLPCSEVMLVRDSEASHEINVVIGGARGKKYKFDRADFNDVKSKLSDPSTKDDFLKQLATASPKSNRPQQTRRLPAPAANPRPPKKYYSMCHPLCGSRGIIYCKSVEECKEELPYCMIDNDERDAEIRLKESKQNYPMSMTLFAVKFKSGVPEYWKSISEEDIVKQYEKDTAYTYCPQSIGENVSEANQGLHRLGLHMPIKAVERL